MGMDMEENAAGSSDKITREYFDSLLLEMRHIDGRKPDTAMELYGKKIKTPIMTAALSHLDKLHSKGMAEMAKGAKEMGAVCFAGMGDEEELEEMCATGAAVVKIIKPYADNAFIFDKIAHANRCGAFAVGMDIDHAFNGAGDYDKVLGYEMRPKTMEEIREFVQASKLPFIVKGVLSKQDAYKCLQAGVKGIVLSHHHGIMDYAVPPLQILPDIVNAVGGEIPIFVDCGILSGMDAFKALALGATAVCVGRAIMEPLRMHGAEGVKETLFRINQELKGVMAHTGCYDLLHMDASVLHHRVK